MRRLALIAALALALPAAAFARPGDRGDGTFVVKNATGQVSVRSQGSALGRVELGSITIIDLSPASSDDIQVLGANHKTPRGDGSVVYSGDKMRFRIVGGAYSLIITGSGINISAVGRGVANATGVSEGVFSADGSAFRAVFGPYTAVFGDA
jgi:hypothetical protein